jgi:hypothetical protein
VRWCDNATGPLEVDRGRPGTACRRGALRRHAAQRSDNPWIRAGIALEEETGMRTILILGALAAATAPSHAATCIVDVGGALGIPGAFASTNAALAVCNNSPGGDVIEIHCPTAGCTDTNVAVLARTGLTIRAAVPGGPVSLLGVNNQPALQITNNSSVVVSGIAAYSAPQIAVWISNSNVDFLATCPDLAVCAYRTFSAPNIGLLVDGASVVELAQPGFNDAAIGISMTTTAAGAPHVVASGAAFTRNRIAASIAGPQAGCNSATKATLELRGDSTAWLNYVLDNNEGFHLRGRSALIVDHAVLANNLDQPGPFNNAYLFALADSSYVEVRNALIYDNDARPGLTGPFAGGNNTASIIYSSTSCARSTFTATSVINNAADLVFNIGGAGLLTLDHVAISGNWGKVLSMSGYFVAHMGACPPLTLIGATVWNNARTADPIACLPAALITWNPNAVAVSPPRTLASYPAIDPPPAAIYPIKVFEPLAAAPLPPGLFDARPWSVDNATLDDDGVLDVGYHNPH